MNTGGFKVAVDATADRCGGWFWAHDPTSGMSALVVSPTLTPAARAAAFTLSYQWHQDAAPKVTAGAC